MPTILMITSDYLNELEQIDIFRKFPTTFAITQFANSSHKVFKI